MSYLNHIKSAADLITPRAVTAQVFIEMAIERNRRATVYVHEGKVLRTQANAMPNPAALVATTSLQEAVLTAAGVSDKAKGYFLPADRLHAISEFANTFLIPAGIDFPDELVSRYLLTRGDTLGGSMRNVVGYIASVKLIGNIIAALNVLGLPFMYQDRVSGQWLAPSPLQPDIERHACSLSWYVNGNSRTLLQNVTVPSVTKNVDLCLFDCAHNEIVSKKGRNSVLSNPSRYIALGELKGGIDPAGADEHWKTARSALDRIRSKMSGKQLFFIGAAIVKDMSDEIWNNLQNGDLSNAANLTNDMQTASIATWLVTL